jgi:hypothetical protein
VSRGDPQLHGHQVQARDGLGDRMLDLDAAVDLEKVGLTVGGVDLGMKTRLIPR